MTIAKQSLTLYLPAQDRGGNKIHESRIKMNTLNKAQQRDITKIISYGATLGDDYIARGLSALYRSALKTSQQNTILGLAIVYKVASNPEFITGRRA